MKTLLTLLICTLFALRVTAQEAVLKRAEDTARKILGPADLTIAKQTDSYCVMQRSDGRGYVVVSMREGARRCVLGYSHDSPWDEDKMPPCVAQWFKQIERKGEKGKGDVGEGGEVPDDTPNAKEDVKPLLTCHWHQNSPYNDMSPVIADGNVKCVAGCVAIAAAQIIYYWRKDNPPATLRNTPTYIYSTAPVTEVVEAGTPNHWELMQDRYDDTSTDEARQAAAQLCYVIGTSSYLNFASSTSGSIHIAANAMYSQYRLLSEYATKSKYKQREWQQLLYDELREQRPVLCSGQGSGGHAFVLDGYDAQTDLYHFNFGWGGDGDGYYPVDDTEEAMGGFYEGQAVAYQIRPETRNIDGVLQLQPSASPGKSDITIDITNNSTLDIKRLFLYKVATGLTLNAADEPVWTYEEAIPNNGQSLLLTAQEVTLTYGQDCTFYLTDENKYVICHLRQEYVSDINNVEVPGDIPQEVIYDLQGRKTLPTTNGVYIIKQGGKRKKIFVDK